MAMLTTIGFLIKFDSDKIIIGKFMNMDYVGLYSIGATLMLYYRNFIGSIARILRPRFAYLDGMAVREDAINLFINSTRISAILASCGAATIIIVGPSFIRIWVGKGYEELYIVLFILACAQMIDQSQTPSISLLGGFGKQGIVAMFTISDAIASIFLSIFFLNLFGLKGVALGYSLPLFITQGILRPLYICRYLKIKLTQYYKLTVTKPWALTGLCLFFVLGLKIYDIFDNWLILIVVVSLIILNYLIISFFLIFNKLERCRIIDEICKCRIFFVKIRFFSKP
jgi:O-antigen/teichoic acid export membrane protein